MMTNSAKSMVKKLTLGGILTAFVFVFQMLGGFVRFGMFSVSLVLIPIVIGGALCGKWIGAWLGLVFSLAVFASGDATIFWAIDVPGTIITVICKGVACGFMAGFVYELLGKTKTPSFAKTLVSAVTCAVVNTGIFLVGCGVFFADTLNEWAAASGYGGNVLAYAFLGLVGVNFLIELAINLVCSPGIVKLVGLWRW